MRTVTPPILMLALSAAAIPQVTADDAPPFKITTRRDNDRVEVQVARGKATFSIHSPFGISHAKIERLGKTWPEVVVLRLQLQGLENFKLATGTVKLEGSASLHDSKPELRLWKEGQEDSPLEAKSPYWMDVRILDGDGKPATGIPLREGCFELKLPAAVFEGNPQAITVSWIDFYRD